MLASRINVAFNYTFSTKKFYSTSLNPLLINSTPDNIVFDQNKAVLVLPSIHSVTCMEDDGEVIDSFEDLNTICCQTEKGYCSVYTINQKEPAADYSDGSNGFKDYAPGSRV